MGEKFAPDLHTGTGNFSVPLNLPPGRNGFQPSLSLAYSSGHPNSPFGLGWDISVPLVARKTSNGLPQYNDAASDWAERDVFILSGAEDLVITSDSATITSYRPRTEGLFARIRRYHNPSARHDYWEVRTKDGLVSLTGRQDKLGTTLPPLPTPITATKSLPGNSPAPLTPSATALTTNICETVVRTARVTGISCIYGKFAMWIM
jgi:hypothetical protein